jgi:hypothetical protein
VPGSASTTPTLVTVVHDEGPRERPFVLSDRDVDWDGFVGERRNVLA